VRCDATRRRSIEAVAESHLSRGDVARHEEDGLVDLQTEVAFLHRLARAGLNPKGTKMTTETNFIDAICAASRQQISERTEPYDDMIDAAVLRAAAHVVARRVAGSPSDLAGHDLLDSLKRYLGHVLVGPERSFPAIDPSGIEF
jgi:hypothetical protein